MSLPLPADSYIEAINRDKSDHANVNTAEGMLRGVWEGKLAKGPMGRKFRNTYIQYLAYMCQGTDRRVLYSIRRVSETILPPPTDRWSLVERETCAGVRPPLASPFHLL